ncbi:hypothetical protein CBS147343_10569 [Aspergillus niger]|nr:hypothetical protein CBS11350_2498 [Aspergillus niger]KAI2852670.1 hypothetical protein CBS12448_8200 [Aspergillus niger]KAI2908013.1 hypothetical protein CBS147371_10456 [Aspergillus niger]KAI2943837.1 hypothetical protein CBS147322_8213 [Aspergillus niger]KAI2950121.1 hypothetical protein CBS147321_1763 [Aspergillus niger]
MSPLITLLYPGSEGSLVVTYHCRNNRTIKEWRPNGRDSIIPTLVSYHPHTQNLHHWGHKVGRQDDHLVLLKLQVAGVPSTELVDWEIFGNAKLPGVGRNAIQPQDAIRDFLGALGDAFRADQTILQDIGLSQLPPIDWYFAMPDCWTVEGDKMMQSAIREARFEDGADRVFYTSEAKAAAIRVASQLEEEGLAKVGDRVLVCDLGGVTCDYTVFRVSTTTNEPHHLLFHPLSEKSTMKHGSHLIEASFMRHIRTTLNLPIGKGQVAAMALDRALEAKHGFSGDEAPVVYLPFTPQYKSQCKYKPSIQFNEQTSHFTFTRASVDKAFDPVVRSITNAILHHISACNVTQVVLVGGFSQSVYLRKEVKRRLQDIDEAERPTLRHLKGNDAITAVAYGLALRGSMVSAHMQYQSIWGYELAAPVIEMRATGLEPPRKHAFRVIHSGRAIRQEGSVHLWLAVEAGQCVQSVLIRRFTEMPNRVQAIGELKLNIPDKARCGVYYPPDAEAIFWYECLASWTVYTDVRDRMRWKLSIRTDKEWEEVNTEDHLVTDMSPWH